MYIHDTCHYPLCIYNIQHGAWYTRSIGSVQPREQMACSCSGHALQNAIEELPQASARLDGCTEALSALRKPNAFHTVRERLVVPMKKKEAGRLSRPYRCAPFTAQKPGSSSVYTSGAAGLHVRTGG